MKRTLLTITALLTFFIGSFSFGSHAAAFDVFGPACQAGAGAAACQHGSADPVTHTISRVIRIVSIIAGIGAIIVISVAGIMYVTAHGDANQVSNAKTAIIYSFVGLIIIILAQPIIAYIVERVTQ